MTALPDLRTLSRALLLVTGLLVLAPSGPGLSAQEPAAQDPTVQDADEDDPFLLPDIVVTATRVPLDRDRLPTPTTVLTGEELRERGITSVADALRTVPGMAVIRAGSQGGQTSLFLRGGESNYVKVLVDGVPVNDAGGAIDLADLSTAHVERIEVVRGPTSVLYGSDAVVGVVQIFTLRGRDDASLEAGILGGLGERRYEDGTYGLMEADAAFSGATGAISYAVGGSRNWTAGAYPMNNERTLHAANARAAWRAGAATELSLAARVTDSQAGLPTDGAGNLVSEDAQIDRRHWTLSAEAVHRPLDPVQLRFHLGRTERSQVTLDDGGDPTPGTYFNRFGVDITRTIADLRLSADLPRSILSVGAAHEASSGATDFESDGEFGPFAAEATYDRSNTSGYAELLFEPSSGLHLTTGGRMDHNEAFGRFDTYRLGVAWEAIEGLRLRGATGRAFREPTFAENFGSGFGDIGNEALVPERTRSWEVGVEQTVGPARLAATWFDQTFRDMIQFTFVTQDPDDPNYFNVGAASASGLELSAEVAVGSSLLSGTFTHLSTEVLDPGLATDETFVEGEPLLRRPARSGSMEGRLPFDRGVVGLTVAVVGEREDMDFGTGFPAPRVTLPSYGTVALFGEYLLPLRSGPPSRVLVRVENLLDRDYQSISGFPAPGRIMRLGVRVGGP